MDELLENSEGLHSEFSRIFDYGVADDSQRVTSSWIMCLVALEIINRTAMLTSSQKGCSSFNYDGCYVDFLQLN